MNRLKNTTAATALLATGSILSGCVSTPDAWPSEVEAAVEADGFNNATDPEYSVITLTNATVKLGSLTLGKCTFPNIISQADIQQPVSNTTEVTIDEFMPDPLADVTGKITDLHDYTLSLDQTSVVRNGNVVGNQGGVKITFQNAEELRDVIAGRGLNC